MNFLNLTFIILLLVGFSACSSTPKPFNQGSYDRQQSQAQKAQTLLEKATAKP